MGILNNNILPYILLVVLGWGAYVQNEKQNMVIEAQAKANEQALADNNQAYETMSVMQEYNQMQFDELGKRKKEVTKYGKNTGRY